MVSKAHPYDTYGFQRLQETPLKNCQILDVKKPAPASENQATLLVFQTKKSTALVKFLGDQVGDLFAWQKQRLAAWEKDLQAGKKADIFKLSSDHAPYWCVRLDAPERKSDHGGSLKESPYARARNLVGAAMNDVLMQNFSSVLVKCVGTNEEQELGTLVALDLASYRFKGVASPKLLVQGSAVKKMLPQAISLATGTNIARHLVNLPANALNPATYAEIIEKLFKPFKTISVEIWEEDKLKKEKMGLLLAVGQGAKELPRFVHLRYRPTKGSKKTSPIAFVGKGITFDSGGLDIKPSSGMRLMKKDMGGSASLVGLALWLASSEHPAPCDFYLALAENAVSRDAFRPGDVIVSRSGKSVEIHNTDAEGRLVLADAMDVALSQDASDAPSCMIDVATLTGAIKLALGSDMYGLFGNDDKLAQKILASSQATGELGWRMPLYEKYETLLASNFADLANASDAKFGGLIASALFLKKFVKDVPWAHLDIYAWTDAPSGAYGEPGGTGQCVQALANFLESQV